MRQAFKHLFYGAVDAVGLTQLASRLSRRHVPVLLYHGVTDRRWPAVLDCEKKHMRVEDFEAQLAFLKQRYQVVPLSRYTTALKGGPALPEGCAVITFDDGYADNFTTAFPLLKKYGLPATVFLASDFVTRAEPLWVDRLAWAFACTELGDWEDPLEHESFPLSTEPGKIAGYLWVKRRLKLVPDAEREELLERICQALLGSRRPLPPELFCPLSREQVRAMLDSGLVEIGSHGCRHAILTSMSQRDAALEMTESKSVLEEFCGREVSSFSYPNGDFNPALARLAAETGYSCAVAGGLRLNTPQDRDPYAIWRLALAEGDSRAVMAATLSGIRSRMIALAGGRA